MGHLAGVGWNLGPSDTLSILWLGEQLLSTLVAWRTEPGKLRFEGKINHHRAVFRSHLWKQRHCFIFYRVGGNSTVLPPEPSSHPERITECSSYMPCSMRGSLLVCDREARTKKGACILQGLTDPREPRQQVLYPWPFSEGGLLGFSSVLSALALWPA